MVSNSSFLHTKKDPQRLTKELRKNSEKFHWDGIVFPASLKDIDKFEKQNYCGICVITWDKENRFGIAGFHVMKPCSQI